MTEIEAGRFSFMNFYERRARRILPALLIVVLATTIAGVFVFLPEDLIDLAKSIIASSLFSSNILFPYQSGYFDAPSDLKPLLHTWSLSVEEQFYLLHPLFLLLLYRQFRSRTLSVIGGIAVVSLAISVWAVARHPSAAFFLLPSRAWELLLGTMLAVPGFPIVSSRFFHQFAGTVGLSLIVWTSMSYVPQSSFPGLAAVPPAVGAALVIYSGTGGKTIVSRMLAMPAMVAIGLLSYSLYLWHWPILVIVKYAIVRQLNVVENIFLLTVIVTLSCLTWLSVERPLRYGTILRSGRALIGAIVSIVICCAFGGLVLLTSGLPTRIDSDVLRLLAADPKRLPPPCFLSNFDRGDGGKICVRGAAGRKPSFVLAGDSHADAMMPGLFRTAEYLGLSGYQFTAGGFRPLPGVFEIKYPERTKMNQEFLNFLRSEKSVQLVILVGWWELQASGKTYRHHDVEFRDERYDGSGVAYNRKSMQRGLENLIDNFPDRLFVLVEDVPTGRTLDRAVAARLKHIWGQSALEYDFGVSRDEYNKQLATYTHIFQSLASRRNVTIVSLSGKFCNEKFCTGSREGVLLYRDGDHLSESGSDMLHDIFKEMFLRGNLTPG